MFKSYLCAVYGTLRKGCGNHTCLNGAELVKTCRVSGYKMYSLGGFPACVKSDDDNDMVQVEVYNITTYDQQRSLDSLEGYCRGESDQLFYDVDIVDADGEAAEMYVFKSSDGFTDEHIIKSGDWVKYGDRF